MLHTDRSDEQQTASKSLPYLNALSIDIDHVCSQVEVYTSSANVTATSNRPPQRATSGGVYILVSSFTTTGLYSGDPLELATPIRDPSSCGIEKFVQVHPVHPTPL